MATMIPELSEPQLSRLKSRAEAKVYRSFRDNLPASYVVVFEPKWILKPKAERAGDGENDFLVCHPEQGYLCIEVKGGGISFDAASDKWYSVDRHQQKHGIKDPVRQSLEAKYAILAKLKEHPKWGAHRLQHVLRGHGVFFPDVGNSKPLARPDMPAELIGVSGTLREPQSWIDAMFSYWGRDSGNITRIGQGGVDFVKEVFARSFFVTPLVSAQLADLEEHRLKLTNEQMRILDMLRSHRRLAVSGGAGTGKTVLALEKARRLASEGFKTLLTCYNRQLADHLSELCREVHNLDVMSFHQLCYHWVERASQISGRDLNHEAKTTYPGTGFFDVQLPIAFSFALDEVQDRYEAIVCDEGQDFSEEFWFPLELLLTDSVNSPFYVFFDDNQNLYARAGSFPIKEPAVTLTRNCRNTTSIHDAAYKYYKGIAVEPPELEGEDLQFDLAPGQAAQVRKIHNRIVDLIDRQGVAPDDITILIADAQRKYDYYAALQKLPLPKPAIWLEEGRQTKNAVRLETVQRFKGLESQIIILWGLDTADLLENRELLYVGLSRAKSLLIISGSASTAELLKNAGKF